MTQQPAWNFNYREYSKYSKALKLNAAHAKRNSHVISVSRVTTRNFQILSENVLNYFFQLIIINQSVAEEQVIVQSCETSLF